MALGNIMGGIAGGATVAIVITAVDRYSKELNKAQKQMAAMGAAAVIAGAVIAGAFIKTIPGARDLAEETSKLYTIFDEINADQLAKDIEELGKAYILSNRETIRLIASTGDLLTGLGFADDVALQFSIDVVKMGADLASFNNFVGGAAGAAKILEKALLGERESLKSLGISILESDIKTQLLIDGTNELTGLALKQAKATATLALIQQQSANAIGDTARTAGDLANVQRELKRQTENLSDSIGKVLLPMALKITSALVRLVEKFNDLTDGQRRVIVVVGLVVAAMLIFGGAITLFTTIILPGLTTAFTITGIAASAMLGPFGLVLVAIAAITVGIITFRDKNLEAAASLNILGQEAGFTTTELEKMNVPLKISVDLLNQMAREQALLEQFGFALGQGTVMAGVGPGGFDFSKALEEAQAGIITPFTDPERFLPVTTTSPFNVTNITVTGDNYGVDSEAIAEGLSKEMKKKIGTLYGY